MGKKGSAAVRQTAQLTKAADRAKRAELGVHRVRNKFAVLAKGEDALLEKQLEHLGLHIRYVKGDGNCLFRVLADQLEGNESLHAGYRAEVLRFMCGHREDFEPFVEDDEAWDHYVGRMARDSTWGGNLELQAASRRYEVNIVIHILEAPPYEILNPAAARAIHMSYHGGEHYNSVRHKDDLGRTPAVHLGGGVLGRSTGDGARRSSATADDESGPVSRKERIVMQSTDCASLSRARAALARWGGSVDAAVEELVAEAAETADRAGDSAWPGEGDAARAPDEDEDALLAAAIAESEIATRPPAPVVPVAAAAAAADPTVTAPALATAAASAPAAGRSTSARERAPSAVGAAGAAASSGAGPAASAPGAGSSRTGGASSGPPPPRAPAAASAAAAATARLSNKQRKEATKAARAAQQLQLAAAGVSASHEARRAGGAGAKSRKKQRAQAQADGDAAAVAKDFGALAI